MNLVLSADDWHGGYGAVAPGVWGPIGSDDDVSNII